MACAVSAEFSHHIYGWLGGGNIENDKSSQHIITRLCNLCGAETVENDRNLLTWAGARVRVVREWLPVKGEGCVWNRSGAEGAGTKFV